jgi:hypothetical protein
MSTDKPPFDAAVHSDGCTMFPDGCWREACVEHDRAYYYGGTDDERRAADLKLLVGVSERGWWQAETLVRWAADKPGIKFIAWVLAPVTALAFGVLGLAMYFGVRVGGARWHRFGWQWGFGND